MKNPGRLGGAQPIVTAKEPVSVASSYDLERLENPALPDTLHHLRGWLIPVNFLRDRVKANLVNGKIVNPFGVVVGATVVAIATTVASVFSSRRTCPTADRLAA